ncbi:MAG: hypothetical protein ABWZ65_06220 [Pseudomonas mandelii]
MKGLSILLGCILVGAASLSFAADPSFTDFTVTEAFAGPNHALAPQVNSNQLMDEARAQALAGQVNFAGHYVLHRVGCGGSTTAEEPRPNSLLRVCEQRIPAVENHRFISDLAKGVVFEKVSDADGVGLPRIRLQRSGNGNFLFSIPGRQGHKVGVQNLQ